MASDREQRSEIIAENDLSAGVLDDIRCLLVADGYAFAQDGLQKTWWWYRGDACCQAKSTLPEAVASAVAHRLSNSHIMHTEALQRIGSALSTQALQRHPLIAHEI
jgi:hypothetical protein